MFIDQDGVAYTFEESSCNLSIGQRMALLDMYLSSEFKSLSDQELREAVMSLYDDYLRKEDESRAVAPQLFLGDGEEERINGAAVLSILHQITTNNKSASGHPIKMPLTSDWNILRQQLMFDSTHPDLMTNFRDQVIQVGDLVTIQFSSEKLVTGIVTDVTPQGVGLYFPRLGWPNQLGYEFFDLATMPETGWVFSLNYDNGPFKEEIPPNFEITGEQLKDLAAQCVYGDRATAVATDHQQETTKKWTIWPWLLGGLAVAGGLLWLASQSSRSSNPVDPGVEILVAEARDPKTPFERLQELVSDPEEQVRRAVLENTNLCPTDEDGTPYPELLAHLAGEFPEEVALHPAFALHALIEPNNAFEGVVTEMVERTNDAGLIARLWTTWGTSSSNMHLAFAGNPNTPKDILRTLGSPNVKSENYVRISVAKNPNTPEDTLRFLGNETTESNEDVRAEVASNPSTPKDVLRILGNPTTESDNHVRKLVAMNPNSPADILRILGNPTTESYWIVRYAVASNPNTPGETLRALGKQKSESNWEVRRAVAENPSTPVDLLRSLVNPKTEPDWFVRQAATKSLAARGLA